MCGVCTCVCWGLKSGPHNVSHGCFLFLCLFLFVEELSFQRSSSPLSSCLYLAGCREVKPTDLSRFFFPHASQLDTALQCCKYKQELPIPSEQGHHCACPHDAPDGDACFWSGQRAWLHCAADGLQGRCYGFLCPPRQGQDVAAREESVSQEAEKVEPYTPAKVGSAVIC